MRNPLVNLLIVKNALWLFWGFGFRLGIQVIYFILLARILGSEAYGRFAGVLAVVTVLSPFASWGSGNILIKHVSRNPGLFSFYWGSALTITLLTGIALSLLSSLIVALVFDWQTALALSLPIALGDLVGVRLADVSSQAFQSRERMRGTSLLWVVISLSRLLGTLILAVFPQLGLYGWAFLYALSGLLAGAVGVIWVTLRLGKGVLGLAPLRGEWKEGFYFSLSLASQGAYNDVDKALLSRLDSDLVAGNYASAYRVLEATFAPIRAILYASYPRFFQAGHAGLKSSRSFALSLLPLGLIFSLLGGGIVWATAPFLPLLLGQDYSLSVHIAPLMAPVLVLRTLHYLAADALTGAGYQGVRSAVQLVVALVSLALNLWLIPAHGWLGAVWSTWVSQGLLVLLLWAFVFRLEARENDKVG